MFHKNIWEQLQTAEKRIKKNHLLELEFNFRIPFVIFGAPLLWKSICYRATFNYKVFTVKNFLKILRKSVL